MLLLEPEAVNLPVSLDQGMGSWNPLDLSSC